MCAACAVSPRGRKHSSSSSATLQLLLIRTSSEFLSVCRECRTHTPTEVTLMRERSSPPCFSCLPACHAFPRLFLACLHTLPSLLSSTSSSQCEHTDARAHTFWLVETHLLPRQPAVTRLLRLNRQRPHWLVQGGRPGGGWGKVGTNLSHFGSCSIRASVLRLTGRGSDAQYCHGASLPVEKIKCKNKINS